MWHKHTPLTAEEEDAQLAMAISASEMEEEMKSRLPVEGANGSAGHHLLEPPKAPVMGARTRREGRHRQPTAATASSNWGFASDDASSWPAATSDASLPTSWGLSPVSSDGFGSVGSTASVSGGPGGAWNSTDASGYPCFSSSPPTTAAHSAAGVPVTSASHLASNGNGAASGNRRAPVAINWAIDQGRLAKYEGAFRKADQNQDGFVEKDEAMEVLTRAELPASEMAHIFAASDCDRDGRLSFVEFLCTVHLAYRRAREGLPLPSETPAELQAAAHAAIKEAQRQRNWTAPASSGPQSPQALSSSPVSPTSTIWNVSEAELQHYYKFFQSMEKDGCGLVSGQDARPLFDRSGLAATELAHIWQLADTDRDGFVSKAEFTCAMILIARKRQGTVLPTTMPENLLMRTGQAGPGKYVGLPESAPKASPSSSSIIVASGREFSPKATAASNGSATDPECDASRTPVCSDDYIATPGHDPSLEAGVPSTATIGLPSLTSVPNQEEGNACTQGDATGSGETGGRISTGNDSRAAASGGGSLGATVAHGSDAVTAGSPWELASSEIASYEAMFRKLDPDGSGYVAPQAARQMLESSGLPVSELTQIWRLADADADGRLSKREFCIAVALTARRRQGASIPESIPPEMLLSPRLSSGGGSSTGTSAGMGNDAASTESPWVVSESELVSYEAFFTKLDPDDSGYVAPQAARQMLESSGLPVSELTQIWRLADADADGRLSKPEFCIALALTARRRQGASIPDSLPSEMLLSQRRLSSGGGSSTGASAGMGTDAASTESPWVVSESEMVSYEAFFTKLDPDGSGYVAPQAARQMLESSGLPVSELTQIWRLADADADGRLNKREFCIALALTARRRQGASIPDSLPPEMLLSQHVGASSAPRNDALDAHSPWVVSESDMASYEAIFRKLDTNGSGVVAPQAARQMLESSGLPVSDLTQIWRLADADADGHLNLQKFALAMALAARRRQGAPLPNSVPPEMLQTPPRKLDGGSSM